MRSILSLPLRERGLKSSVRIRVVPESSVAPLAGAWIEIYTNLEVLNYFNVAPLAGAWIEIL